MRDDDGAEGYVPGTIVVLSLLKFTQPPQQAPSVPSRLPVVHHLLLIREQIVSIEINEEYGLAHPLRSAALCAFS
ncbi:hypothetical protein EHV23_05630 [Lautropia dentalis]|uniref:Uncharacterized protein n=1 Tax=Lautropia dentalis TaxID=2490857 RepID=A0A3R8T3R7_9BURK|nr:hypothetical protein [Lautropia dentalis]RRN45637.1 hypothetical protein EHV23_05630 [Lautropia dentalis]